MKNDSRLYFHLSDLERELGDSMSFSEYFESLVTMKVKNLRDLCGRLPRENEIFFIETYKSFTAFAFIVYLMRHAGRVRHLYVATYSTNARVINSIVRYHNKGLLGTIHFHVSETLKFRMPSVFRSLQELAESGVVTLTFGWSHKKIACVDTEDGQFVIEGSGNYGENALEEQYVFLRSKKVYEFRSTSDGVGR